MPGAGSGTYTQMLSQANLGGKPFIAALGCFVPFPALGSRRQEMRGTFEARRRREVSRVRLALTPFLTR